MSASPNEVTDTRDMNMVHRAFRREFRLAPGLVRGVTPGDHARTDVIARHLDLMTDMLYHHHHAEDEILWPMLHERVPDDIQPIVSLMEEHHHRIHAANDSTIGLLAQWRNGAPKELGEQLAAALEEVDAALDEHLAAEEDQLLPIAAKNMSAAEWNHLGEAAMASIPQKQMPLAFGMIQYEGDPEVMREMLSHAPFMARLIVPFVAPRAFKKYATKVYGTPSPTRCGVRGDQNGA